MIQGCFHNYNSIKREIWVNRADSILEFKIWFVYTFKFVGKSKQTIIDFLKKENDRFNWNEKINSEQLKAVSKDYSNLETNNQDLPPRLWSITEKDLINLNTELFTNSNGFLFGDSVGGISPKKPETHNEHFKSKLFNQETILFSPGVLARIVIEIEGINNYIFQLAEKNLRKKGEIFYKPIGGHIKATAEKYDALVKKFKLIPKDHTEIQDVNDVAFYIKTELFEEFNNLFSNDIFIKKNYFYFENPEISITRELYEELGPIASSDGISLLTEEDFKSLDNDKIS